MAGGVGHGESRTSSGTGRDSQILSWASMQVTGSKIFALVIALGYIATAIAMSGWDIRGGAAICLMLSLPLAFIWFPDEIGAFTRLVARRGYGRIDTETPAFMLTLVG